MANLKELSKDTLIYGSGRVLKKIIGLFLLPFYTRALNPEQYGILDTLATFSMFVLLIFGLGLQGATSRYFFIAKGEVEKKKLLFTSLLIRIFSYAVPVVILLIFSTKLSKILFDTETLKWVVMISVFTIMITALMEMQSQIFRFYRMPWKYTIVNSLRAFLNPLFGITFVVILHWGVFGATLSSMISSSIVLMVAFIFFTKKYYVTAFSRKWAKKLLVFGYPLIFTALLVWVNNVSDRFFLLHYSNLDQIGLYSIGNTFTQPISFLNTALKLSGAVLMFSLYNEEKEDDKPRTKIFLTKYWYTYLVFSISIAVLISVFSYEIVNFVTTPKYIMGILAIPFLAFGSIIFQCSQITGNGMTLKEKSKPYFWIMLIAALTNAGLNFYFVPRFGFVGAAITTVTSNFLYFAVAYFWSQKVFYIKRSFLKPMLYFFLALGVSVFFPFYQIYHDFEVNFGLKIFALLLTMSIPFLFKLVNLRMISSLARSIIRKG